jgi:hypothetical protein
MLLYHEKFFRVYALYAFKVKKVAHLSAARPRLKGPVGAPIFLAAHNLLNLSSIFYKYFLFYAIPQMFLLLFKKITKK